MDSMSADKGAQGIQNGVPVKGVRVLLRDTRNFFCAPRARQKLTPLLKIPEYAPVCMYVRMYLCMYVHK